ncbi:MAG: extensin family protein [Parvibaculaceae bacterium]
MFGLIAVLGCSLAGAAVAGTVPLPRPKPALDQHAPDDLAAPEARRRVPIPRPKPSLARDEAPARRLATSAEGPLRAGEGGEISVSLADIGRERDPETARNLAPGAGSHWTTAQIGEARDRCAFVLAATNIEAEEEGAMGGPEGCGIAAPVKVAAFGAVDIKPSATLNCPMALAVYKWMTDVVQPAARKYFEEPVVAIRNASSYACRRRNNSGRGRISEHSFGNALDISAFVLASGRSITVEGDWSTLGSFFGLNDRASFLKTIHSGACESFSTVLGPRANALHENHFHIDLGRGGYYKFCR